MLLEHQFRRVTSGESKGLLSAAVRVALAALEIPYTWGVRRRNRRFDRGTNEIHRVPAPVISVGNLTVGGTGKTPLVAWLARWLKERHCPVSVISRGYASTSNTPNDESLELAARLPDLRLLQNPDRLAAARCALKENPHQALILDDAFQHRRLARDLDIVLIDAIEPFGYEHLLPRGLLREPVEYLGRADIIGLSRSDAVDGARRAEIHSRVRSVAPNANWLELCHRPTRLVSHGGETLTLDELSGLKAAAFCGIGNPFGFRHTLASCGLRSGDFLTLPDHCRYDSRRLAQIAAWASRLPIEHLICTRKDLVKLPRDEIAGHRLWAIDIELEIVSGQDQLEHALETIWQRAVGSAIPRPHILPDAHCQSNSSSGRSRR